MKQEVKIQFCDFDLNVKCLRKPSILRRIKQIKAAENCTQRYFVIYIGRLSL